MGRERTSICAAGPVAMQRWPVGNKSLVVTTSDANTWLIISPLHGGVYARDRWQMPLLGYLSDQTASSLPEGSRK